MAVWLSVACGILAVAGIALFVKLMIVRRSERELLKEFSEILAADTNRLITLSAGSGYLKSLAAELNRQLACLRAERLRYERGDAELKDTISNISHDLRTPLTAISGYLELLEGEEVSPDVKRYLSIVSDRVAVLKELAEEFFRYSVDVSVRQLRIEPVSLNRVLEESVISFAAAMEQKRIAPQITFPQKEVVRSLDRSALSRVFGNLIGNALKYSDGDFCVSLDEEGTVCFSNRARRLDSVTAEKLFHRFFTVETGSGSTGLGLSIAKLLTERMGGNIHLRFEDGILNICVMFPAQENE